MPLSYIANEEVFVDPANHGADCTREKEQFSRHAPRISLSSPAYQLVPEHEPAVVSQ